jgi:hypothetical protein
MDIWMLLAKALVSLVAIASALGGALADLVALSTYCSDELTFL